MKRREFLGVAGLALVIPETIWGKAMNTTEKDIAKLKKPDDEWRAILERSRAGS